MAKRTEVTKKIKGKTTFLKKTHLPNKKGFYEKLSCPKCGFIFEKWTSLENATWIRSYIKVNPKGCKKKYSRVKSHWKKIKKVNNGQ